MPPILSMSMWVALPDEQRNRIRRLFSIPRSKTVEVHDGHLVTDGTTAEDFKALTIEKMQRFTQNTSVNFHELFDLTVTKVQINITEGLPTVMPEIEVLQVSSVTPVEVIPAKKRGRPAKKNANEKK